MNAEFASLAQRFARLSAPKRKIFLERLQGEGLDFAALPIVARDPAQDAPLARAQRGLWLAWQVAPQSPAYNLAGRLTLRGLPAGAAFETAGGTPAETPAETPNGTPIATPIATPVGPQPGAHSAAPAGGITPAQVEAGVRRLVERHPALRTAFGLDADGQPVQRVRPDATLDWRRVDWATPHQEQDEVLSQREQAFARQPFDLEQGVVFRAELHTFIDGVLALLLGVHHIAADGSSVDLLMAELVADLQVPGALGARPALPIDYADYAAWQHHWLEAGEQARQLAWWQGQLAGLPLATELPLDRPRGRHVGAQGALQSFRLEAATSAALLALARQHAASPYMVTVALLNLWVAAFCGERDICIGLPTVNRGREELDGVVGHFTNVLPLRVRVDPRAGFLPLLLQVRDGLLDAKRHADLPLDLLVEHLAVARQPGLHPFFQIKCAQQSASTFMGAGPALQVEARGILVDEVHFDLSLDVVVDGEGLAFDLAYATALFDAQTIARMVAGFQALAVQAAAAPQRPIDLLTLPGEGSVLEPETRLWPATSVLSLFKASATQRPDAVALTQGDERYSYAELEEAAQRWAQALRSLGIGPDERVAICMERSPAFVLAMLATLKAGAAFVPLDPSAPPTRLAQLLNESQACALLVAPGAAQERASDDRATHATRLARAAPMAHSPESPESAESTAGGNRPDWAGALPVLALSFAPDAINANNATNATNAADPSSPHAVRRVPQTEGGVHPDQAAYVIFTSGSTGRPKGVVVSHGALANYVQGLFTRLALPAGASFAMVSTVAADLGHTSLFGALCNGGALHLMDHSEAFDPDAFARRMRHSQADALKIVPSHLRGLLNAGQAADVLPARLLIVGGESADEVLLNQIRQLRPDLRILNHYGPTETTVGVLTQDLPAASPIPAGLALGRPLPNMQAYVLDADLQVVQPGMTGELYMGGPGVARGYGGQPGQTAGRFIASPFQHGERLYRTGDKVRLDNDGALRFLGRQDDQVKIRGYRVEPGEVQALLRESPQVADAYVLAGRHEQGAAELWAYVVPAQGQPLDVPALRAHWQQTLPAHLVPAVIVPLAALPLNANGKVDRHSLPRPDRRSDVHMRADLRADMCAGEATPASFGKAGDAGNDSNGLHDAHEHGGGGVGLGGGSGGGDGDCGTGRTAPRDPAEQAIAALWADLLGIDARSINRSDSFFGLGGDSILSLKLMTRLRRTVHGGDRLSLPTVMQAVNLGALADALRQGLETSHDAVRLSRSGAGQAFTEGKGAPLYCVPGMIVNTREFEPLAQALGPDRPVHAFVSHVYTAQRWRGFAIPALAGEYADYIAATAAGGRCALLGWSSGGDLAHELVQRLKGRVQVDFVGLVDVFETEPLRARRALTDGERTGARERIEAWLSRSTMADTWRALIDRMDPQELDCIAENALIDEQPLPLDGSDEDAAEYLLWTTLDKRVQATRYAYPPSDVPVHVYLAEESLQSDGRLRDWSAHAPVAHTRDVAGSTHLSIIRHEALLADLAQRLAAIDA
ncbi:amino acid adenylation domain-containing protein [Roseateles sp. YR242]|uniref:AMP-binding protein n=1 Tax=Roseateles sp. YR242 TaxID=1855305 RepID=UPI0008C99DBE|nr:AMP-binding protein [Roseateles sp. YR242]SEL61771.1 amino acid adenylation domain-containing protein [Roseateles sp. YR242]